MEYIIGILILVSFFGLAFYAAKGGNLMMGMSAEGVDIFVPETMLEEAKNILEGESENEEL